LLGIVLELEFLRRERKDLVAGLELGQRHVGFRARRCAEVEIRENVLKRRLDEVGPVPLAAVRLMGFIQRLALHAGGELVRHLNECGQRVLLQGPMVITGELAHLGKRGAGQRQQAPFELVKEGPAPKGMPVGVAARLARQQIGLEAAGLGGQPAPKRTRPLHELADVVEKGAERHLFETGLAHLAGSSSQRLRR